MFNSSLFDERTFYRQFVSDLQRAQSEVIIESPFITIKRCETMLPIFKKLIGKGVAQYIVTRDPAMHAEPMRKEAELIVQYFERIGVQVLLTSNLHHRKLAIIDRAILWEGSLNILSQAKSREVMRRIEGDSYAQEMFDFLNLGQFI